MNDSFDEAISYLLDRIRVANEINVPTVNGTNALKDARRELDAMVAKLWRKLENHVDEAAIREITGSLLLIAFDVGHYGPLSDSSWATAKKWREQTAAARAREGKVNAAKAAAIEAAFLKHVPAKWDGKRPNLTSLGDAVAAEVAQSGHLLDPKSAREALRNRFGLQKRFRASARAPIP